jgi:NADH pyrophosphatase NudC (nudix superfamily)
MPIVTAAVAALKLSPASTSAASRAQSAVIWPIPRSLLQSWLWSGARKRSYWRAGPHFPEKFYSVLAGFVDPGETLEQCVIREVYEEVGITVQNIRYFASQPWPFSGSLMIGFVCDWADGEIRVDPLEIEDAGWFALDALPQLPPPLSLARLLIDAQRSS